MKAVLSPRTGELVVEDVPDPDPAGRALVAVQLTGLCGTDAKILAGQIPVDHPRILGHEVIGEVVKAGERMLVPEGTRVLVNPTSWCGHCRLCLADRTHLCPNGALMGRDVDGGFAELIAVDEQQLHPVPEHLDDRAASVLQILGTCVHAQTLTDVFPGHTAAVIGLGVAGLLHVQLLRQRGVERIVGITRSGWKRELALEFGATEVAHPDEAGSAVDAVTDGHGVDLVIEAAGAPSSLSQAIELAAVGGTLVVFGITSTVDPELPVYQLYFKELRCLNARAARARDYASGVDLAASGRLDLEPFWSESHALEQARTAFEALDGDVLKVTMEVT